MRLAGEILIGVIAALHLYFLVLEMFLWTKPAGLRAFQQTAAQAEATKVLAANQGLYNGFLAAGLAWSLIARDPAGLHFQVFFLLCVVAAGVYGSITAARRILYIQALPAALALVLVLLGELV
jgi:putative membrane protein